MKQFQLVFHDRTSFSNAVSSLKKDIDGKKCVVHLFYDQNSKEALFSAAEVLEAECPHAEWFGCSSNANIEHGRLNESAVSAVFTVFERADTQFEVLTYPLSEDDHEALCNDLLEQIDERPWVKGIEILITIRDMSTTYFCDRLSEMRKDISIFGGCAYSRMADPDDVSIFSRKSGLLDSGVVFVLYGGSDLHLWDCHISGWKPLGQKLTITRSYKNHIVEFDGVPAYETYYRYLRIDNDEHFYHNTLEFPITYDRNGTSIVRVPTGCTENGELIVTSDVECGSIAHITYGDPQTILRSILDKAKELADFVPDGIMIFDCASRRTFWGSEDIDRESMPFTALADTAGFYTGGEFHRIDGSLNQHNVTLVIIGMREGEAGQPKKQALLDSFDYSSEHVSMVRRLANFIDVASNELEAANQRLADANSLLTHLVMIDELTGLYNRREIKNRIAATAEITNNNEFALIMLDLDHFKSINDSYGHNEGDLVLRSFSDILRLNAQEADGSAGRWGGEEFMVLLPNTSENQAYIIAEKIRTSFESMTFEKSGRHTVSCGVTVNRPNETAEETCIRVDHGLYDAKDKGRNRTVIV